MESQWKISDKRSPTGEELDQVAHVLSHMDSFRFDVGGISMRLLECPSNSSLLATRLATEVVTRAPSGRQYCCHCSGHVCHPECCGSEQELSFITAFHCLFSGSAGQYADGPRPFR